LLVVRQAGRVVVGRALHDLHFFLDRRSSHLLDPPEMTWAE
jgi:hypothetical protein